MPRLSLKSKCQPAVTSVEKRYHKRSRSRAWRYLNGGVFCRRRLVRRLRGELLRRNHRQPRAPKFLKQIADLRSGEGRVSPRRSAAHPECRARICIASECLRRQGNSARIRQFGDRSSAQLRRQLLQPPDQEIPPMEYRASAPPQLGSLDSNSPFSRISVRSWRPVWLGLTLMMRSLPTSFGRVRRARGMG